MFIIGLMRSPFSSLSPGALLGVSAALAVCSVAAFLFGAVVLGVALSAPSGSSGAPAGGGGPFEGVFDGGDGGAARPRFKGSRPVGLYLMTRMWIATGSLEKAVWYFTPDGRVYHNPAGDFDDASLAAHQGRHGTVRTEGKDLIVNWSDGKETRSEIDRGGGDGFSWDTGLFAPVEPFDDSSELVGRWEGGSSMSFGGGSSITSSSFELRADGTFASSSAASIGSESDESVVSAGSTSSSSGTWKLDGYRLVMTYGDGRVSKGICFPFDDEATPVKPDRFYFMGTLYKKL